MGFDSDLIFLNPYYNIRNITFSKELFNMALSTLTTKGQITIPKPIRDYLNVDSGDKIEFIIDDEGQVIMAAKTLSVRDLAGMVRSKKSISVEDMNEAIANTFRSKMKIHKRKLIAGKGIVTTKTKSTTQALKPSSNKDDHNVRNRY